jgi:hypothetical protein
MVTSDDKQKRPNMINEWGIMSLNRRSMVEILYVIYNDMETVSQSSQPQYIYLVNQNKSQIIQLHLLPCIVNITGKPAGATAPTRTHTRNLPIPLWRVWVMGACHGYAGYPGVSAGPHSPCSSPALLYPSAPLIVFDIFGHFIVASRGLTDALLAIGSLSRGCRLNCLAMAVRISIPPPWPYCAYNLVLRTSGSRRLVLVSFWLRGLGTSEQVFCTW